MSLLLDESNTSLNQILRMSLTHSSANLMQDGRSCMPRSLGMTHPRKLWTPPCFLPVSLERAPARHGRCRTGAFHVIVFRMRVTELPRVRCFYFFVLNAAIRMTISNSTAPTSIIPKPSDVSHIQMVAAQTILRFPSILTLLISLLWGDGRLLDTGGGGRTRTNFNPFPSCEGRRSSIVHSAIHSHFNPLPSCEGRRYYEKLSPNAMLFQSTPLMRGETITKRLKLSELLISIHSPHARGDSLGIVCNMIRRHFNPLPSCEGRPVGCSGIVGG